MQYEFLNTFECSLNLFVTIHNTKFLFINVVNNVLRVFYAFKLCDVFLCKLFAIFYLFTKEYNI